MKTGSSPYGEFPEGAVQFSAGQTVKIATRKLIIQSYNCNIKRQNGEVLKQIIGIGLIPPQHFYDFEDEGGAYLTLEFIERGVGWYSGTLLTT